MTAGGKNVAPAPVEAALESIGVVDRAYVHGDERPYIVALLTLRADAVAEWGAEHGVAPDEVTDDERFLRAVEEAVAGANAAAPGYAVVRRWAIVPGSFTETEGELTATNKLRRSVVGERYVNELDRLYADRDRDT